MRGSSVSGWGLSAALACGACTSVLGDFSSGPSADAGAEATATPPPTDAGGADALPETGSEEDSPSPGPDASCDGGPCATFVAANGDHTCAILADQTVRCWGDNTFGQSLWNGPMPNIATPAAVGGIGPAKELRLGYHFSCALLVDGSVWCWGDDSFDMLGTADAGLAPDAGPDAARVASPPVQVLGPGGATELLAGAYHACAFATSDAGADAGPLVCWGLNNYGQLGVPGGGSVAPPVTSAFTNAVRGGLGAYSTCAVRDVAPAGQCVGENVYGELGRGVLPDAAATDTSPHPVPAAVDLMSSWGQILTFAHSAGYHMGVTLASGDIALWGDNSYGQLGPQFDGGVSPTPMLVPAFDEVTQLSLLEYSSCALRMDGTVWCWGSTAFGQTGNTANVGAIQTVPAPVSGVTQATQIAAGLSHACALLGSGIIECWGDNQSAQLGRSTGTFLYDATPAPVAF